MACASCAQHREEIARKLQATSNAVKAGNAAKALSHSLATARALQAGANQMLKNSGVRILPSAGARFR